MGVLVGRTIVEEKLAVGLHVVNKGSPELEQSSLRLKADSVKALPFNIFISTSTENNIVLVAGDFALTFR